MKLMKLAVAVAFAFAATSAYAFHGGGVASCESCHTMHNAKTSATGTAPAKMGTNTNAVYTAPAFLLQGSDPSSTCLSCHGPTSPGSYHVLDSNTLTTAGQVNANTLNYTPGGDFAWLQIGARKGHNIVAADFPSISGAPAETRKAPPGLTGSTWDGSNFSCVSCHDPHGQSRYDSSGAEVRTSANGAGIAESGSYGAPLEPAAAIGVYRILGSSGWQPKSSASPAITVTAPVAIAPSTYNKSETGFAVGAAGATGQTAVKYVSGMSEWCGTCHGQMHGQQSTGLDATQTKHPSGASATLGTLAANYNAYVATGNLTGTKAYDALVPFEVGGTRAAAVTAAGWADVTQTVDITATAGSNVMCLSCHRAHASGVDSMLRWETGSEGFNVGTSGDFAGSNGAGAYNRVATYYLRGANAASTVYGIEQRNMCNKCHNKD